jgi:hypothetical protein
LKIIIEGSSSAYRLRCKFVSQTVEALDILRNDPNMGGLEHSAEQTRIRESGKER